MTSPAIGTGRAGTTSGPPFVGTTSTASGSALPSTPARCASASVTTAPSWHAGAGAVKWNLSLGATSSTSCVNPTYCGGYGNASCANLVVGVTVPFVVPAISGTYQVVVNWSLRAVVTWTLSNRACPAPVLVNGTGYQSCAIFLDDQIVTSYAHLQDLTTNRTLPVGTPPAPFFIVEHQFLRDESCVKFACTNVSSSLGARDYVIVKSGSQYYNGTALNATHRYALYIQLVGDASIHLEASPRPWPASVANSLDMASSGEGFFVRNVAVV